MVFRVIHSRSRYWPVLALCGHEALAAMERIRMCVTCDRHRTALAPPFAAAVSLHWAGAARAGMWHERSLLAVEHCWRSLTKPQTRRQMKQSDKLASSLGSL